MTNVFGPVAVACESAAPLIAALRAGIATFPSSTGEPFDAMLRLSLLIQPTAAGIGAAGPGT